MSQSEKQSLPAGMLAAAGIVFGDIGTSPLYTLKECLSILPDGAPSALAVMGFLSLIFWALTLIVTLKYVCFVMRADHDGEGGILYSDVTGTPQRWPQSRSYHRAGRSDWRRIFLW
ncbi:hypothetical protein E05_05640 [Plautia stali symbiont]|nr:hypothetical protein E05_05640 [Plautia stali symbiont]